MFKKPLLVAALALASLVAAGQSKTFTCASLNVDGMPKSLAGFNLNPDAKEGAGARAIGQAVARQGWDFISLSEDFNFHNDLMEPIKGYYYSMTWRGELTGSKGIVAVLGSPFDTDGLGLLYNKFVNVTDESWTRWNKSNGRTDQGADELIQKGYRYYLVDLGQGLKVDVYIHHMDAETGEKDIAARESQMQQLVAAIRATDNRRPIIIMGDTNCRYTRDRVYDLLIQGLNEDPRFTCKDPWVEFNYDGKYNEGQLALGQPALMTHTLGYDKGEIVDKIFYVNNSDADGMTLTANSLTFATDFTESGMEGGEPLSDHFPVVATFTITNPSPKLGAQAVYLRNRATGLYLNGGARWGTHTIVDTYGYPYELTEAGTNQYYMHSPQGWLKIEGVDPWNDGDQNARKAITIAPVDGGGYTIVSPDGTALYSPSNAGDEVGFETLQAGKTSQLWDVVTLDELLATLADATPESPVDATYLIKDANFNRNDNDFNGAWNPGGSTIGANLNDRTVEVVGRKINDVEFDHVCRIHTGKSGNTEWIKQTVAAPAALYTLTFKACRDYISDHQFYINGVDVSSKVTVDIKKGGSGTAADVYEAFSTNPDCLITVDDIEVGADGLTIEVKQGQSHSSSVSIFVDDFRLACKGRSKAAQEGLDRVHAALDDVAKRLQELEDGARAHYNNSLVEKIVDNNRVSIDGVDEVQRTYAALAEATKHQSVAGANMTYAIQNWSFEMGWMTGVDRALPCWASTYSGDTGAKYNATHPYTTQGVDGDYLFNTWGESNGSGSTCGPVGQDITGIPNGLYRLSALVTSWEGKELYVYANGKLSQAVVSTGDGQFYICEVEVSVTNNVLSIGAVAAEPGTTPVLPVASAQEIWGGQNANKVKYNSPYFKADNFQLTLLAPEGFNMVRLAIDDVKAKAADLSLDVDLSSYEKALEEYTLAEQPEEAVENIYNLLAAAVRTQTAAGSNYTSAIMNPSFELLGIGMPQFTGWDVMLVGDTKVLDPNAPENVGTYGVSPVDGTYVFNTWVDGSVGYPISNTVKALPGGRYKLTANIASDNGNTYFLVAGDAVSAPIVTTDKGTFTTGELAFEVKQATKDVVIGVRSSQSSTYDPNQNGWWYKTDNFTLTLEELYTPLAAPEATYDADSRTVAITAAEGATVLYSVTTDKDATPTPDQIYTDPIDLSSYEDEVVYVWAKATGVGHLDSENTLVVEAQYVAVDDATLVSYKPVTAQSQIVEGHWYIIVAHHATDGAHALGLNHDAQPVKVNALGEIAATESMCESIAEFELRGVEGAWTLTDKRGTLTLGPVAAASAVRRAAAPNANITLGDTYGGGVQANISWGDSSLGFHNDNKEFGYTAEHSTPVMLYTSGQAANTGVDNVAGDDSGVVEYYNLQGVKVTNPTPGLYIVRRGNQTTKQVIR